MNNSTPVGKTKGQGWEIGVRRTFPAAAGPVWAALMTQPGLGFWLGHGVEPTFKKGLHYQTTEGTRGEIRSYTEGSLIRLTWQPPGSDSDSTLQIRVLPARTGITLSFHHERLQSADQREAMRQHWSAVLDTLGALL